MSQSPIPSIRILAARELLPAEHDVDAGYVTATHIVTAARNEYGIKLVGPVGLDTCHENHEGEHFTQSAFTVDWQARKVTCSVGKISASWSDQRKSSGTPIARVHFTAQDCASCPVREKCTKAANGTWGRSLTLLPQDQQEALEARRREQLADEWQQRYNIRAGVEGTISQAVRRTRTAEPASPACPRPTSATSSPPSPSTSSDSTPGSPKPHSARPGPLT
ncbi:transposase [Streptomyces sp. NPDC004675]|uniref:transposase n=1 Tax=Streptomyces sp. NPDC004675 TaxID=3154286 RepID=UPI0033AAAEE0